MMAGKNKCLYLNEKINVIEESEKGMIVKQLKI